MCTNQMNNPTMESNESGKKVLDGGESVEKDVVEGIEKIFLWANQECDRVRWVETRVWNHPERGRV